MPETLEVFAADVPADLRDADDALNEYGRWATSRGGRKGPNTLDRAYLREADHRESLEAWLRRRAHVPGKPLMSTPAALRVQRALAQVDTGPRKALIALYIPAWPPLPVRLRKLDISPRQCREWHLEGLRLFDRLWRASQPR